MASPTAKNQSVDLHLSNRLSRYLDSRRLACGILVSPRKFKALRLPDSGTW